LKTNGTSTTVLVSEKLLNTAIQKYKKKSGIPLDKPRAVVNEILKWYLNYKSPVKSVYVSDGKEKSVSCNVELRQLAIKKIMKTENQNSVTHRAATVYCLQAYVNYCKESKK
jgi:hypothetical protein